MEGRAAIRDELRAALAALPDERLERTRVFGAGDEPRRWLPLARARFGAGDGGRVGLGLEADWWVESANALLPVEPGAPVPPLLGWLEREPAEVRAELERGLVAAGLPAHGAATFPLDALVEYGLRTTEHWTAHALRWLSSEASEVEITAGIASALGVILREEALPADTRRTVAALVRKRWTAH